MKSTNLAQNQTTVALRMYHECYDNVAYLAATQGKSVRYANALTDEALALCGHPQFKLSHRNWSQEALDYLALFSNN